jgi:hypothetical protein
MLLALLLLVFVTSGPAASQTEPAKPSGVEVVDVKQLQEKLTEIEKATKMQQDAHDRIKALLEYGAALVTLAGILSIIISWWQSTRDRRSLERMRVRDQEEQRRGEARLDEQRARDQEELNISRERLRRQSDDQEKVNAKLLQIMEISEKVATDSQAQLGKFYQTAYGQAQTTLTLINDLLAVTERSARKAAGAQENFLREQIRSLQDRCVTLLGRAEREDEDRALAAKPEYQAEVRVIGEEFDSIRFHVETYNNNLPSNRESNDAATDLKLPAQTLFVKGMHQHLNANYNQAITQWLEARTAPQHERIEAEINYWIGYEHNNLGKFAEAETYFAAAMKHVATGRTHELQRLIFETRFFQRGDSGIEASFVNDVVNGFETAAAALPRTISGYATTVGNIVLVQTLRTGSADLGRAKNYFARALEAHPRSRWARFALLQCKNLEGQQFDGTDQQDIADVIGSVQREYRARTEQRTKVLCKSTEYICQLWLDNKTGAERAYNSLDTHFGQVNSMTVYSQFRKRNVSKEVFWSEIEGLLKTGDSAATMRASNPVTG